MLTAQHSVAEQVFARAGHGPPRSGTSVFIGANDAHEQSLWATARRVVAGLPSEAGRRRPMLFSSFDVLIPASRDKGERTSETIIVRPGAAIRRFHQRASSPKTRLAWDHPRRGSPTSTITSPRLGTP